VLQGRVCIDFTSKLRKEVKGGHGHGVRLKFLLITRREGIGHCVEATRAILRNQSQKVYLSTEVEELWIAVDRA